MYSRIARAVPVPIRKNAAQRRTAPGTVNQSEPPNRAATVRERLRLLRSAAPQFNQHVTVLDGDARDFGPRAQCRQSAIGEPLTDDLNALPFEGEPETAPYHDMVICEDDAEVRQGVFPSWSV